MNNDRGIMTYGQMLDQFGKELLSILQQFKMTAFKPAIVQDVEFVVKHMSTVQQLLVFQYNETVMNFERLHSKMVELENKILNLESKLNNQEDK